MVFINCSANCTHQSNGMCTLDHVGSLSNTTSVGCEFYIEKESTKMNKKDDIDFIS